VSTVEPAGPRSPACFPPTPPKPGELIAPGSQFLGRASLRSSCCTCCFGPRQLIAIVSSFRSLSHHGRPASSRAREGTNRDSMWMLGTMTLISRQGKSSSARLEGNPSEPGMTRGLRVALPREVLSATSSSSSSVPSNVSPVLFFLDVVTLPSSSFCVNNAGNPKEAARHLRL
jgi:hypothetical protein